MSIKVTNEQDQKIGVKNDAPTVVIETEIDATLSINGAAADAKTVGDKFKDIENKTSILEENLYDTVTWKSEDRIDEYFNDMDYLMDPITELYFKGIFEKPKLIRAYIGGTGTTITPEGEEILHDAISLNKVFEVSWKPGVNNISINGIKFSYSRGYVGEEKDKPYTCIKIDVPLGFSWEDNYGTHTLEWLGDCGGLISVSADDIMKNASSEDLAQEIQDIKQKTENFKSGKAAGSITIETGDNSIETGLNENNGAYSANFGRFLSNYAGYSLLSGYNNKNYGRDNAIFGYGNQVGIAPDFSKLTEAGKIQYESTGWTEEMSMYGLNSTGFANNIYNKDLGTGQTGDKAVFDPLLSENNLVFGLNNIVEQKYSIVGGRYNQLLSKEGHDLIVIGHNNYIDRKVENSAIIGQGLKVYNSMAIQNIFGRYNSLYAPAMFIIGNGNSDTKRSNAFMVLKDGAVMGGRATQENDNDLTLVTKGYVKSLLSGSGGEIELPKGIAFSQNKIEIGEEPYVDGTVIQPEQISFFNEGREMLVISGDGDHARINYSHSDGNFFRLQSDRLALGYDLSYKYGSTCKDTIELYSNKIMRNFEVYDNDLFEYNLTYDFPNESGTLATQEWVNQNINGSGNYSIDFDQSTGVLVINTENPTGNFGKYNLEFDPIEGIFTIITVNL
jgi:hypothetical protein